MSGHTPGPWQWDGKWRVCIPHKDGLTCFRTNPEDARLIAAAPAMYETLKGLLSLYDETHWGDLPVGNHPSAIARAALALAEKGAK